jgi:hypothetical protein
MELRARHAATLLVTVLLAVGCEQLGLVRAQLPDLGPPLPLSAEIRFDTALRSASSTYTDACGHPDRPVAIGTVLESALTEAADRTFKRTQLVETPTASTPVDLYIEFTLSQQGFKLSQDTVYDRIPAELLLEVVAVFRDASGKVLHEIPLSITHKDRILILPDQRRCDYLLDPFVQDAAVKLATQFAQAARDVLDPVRAPLAKRPANPLPALAFQAIMLDENGNQILEGGEHVTIRVELSNPNTSPVTGITVTLGGSLASYFPTPTLSVDRLDPGQSRSVEFATKLPTLRETQQAEVTVSVKPDSGAGTPAVQHLTASLRAGVSLSDLVDHIPASSGPQRSGTYVLSVGISVYRDPQIPARKYAARDAELVAGYFQTVGGVPPANIRLLQDRKAVRSNLEASIRDWLAQRVTRESVVIIYFAGYTAVSPSGETYLVPYESTLSSTTGLYPVKDLEARFTRLKPKQVVFIFDGGILTVGQEGRRRGPAWGSSKSPLLYLIGTTGLSSALEPEDLQHGLFTYYLLRGLKGEADGNADGQVTLGELALFLEQSVPLAAKRDFGQDQQPFIAPSGGLPSKSGGLVLSTVAGR